MRDNSVVFKGVHVTFLPHGHIECQPLVNVYSAVDIVAIEQEICHTICAARTKAHRLQKAGVRLFCQSSKCTINSRGDLMLIDVADTGYDKDKTCFFDGLVRPFCLSAS